LGKENDGEVPQQNTPSVDDLSGPEALAILRQLWAEGGPLREKLEREIDVYLSRVVPADVMDAVLADLDGITVEELWERSGETPVGYTHPADESWEIVMERLEPYVHGLNRYIRLGKLEESLLYCVGLLEGLYLFGTESNTEFRRWAEDDPKQAFHWVLDKWKKDVTEGSLRTRMRDELSQRCTGWNVVGL
jgi:hypothetical protein